MLLFLWFALKWIVGNVLVPLVAIPIGVGLAYASGAARSFWTMVWGAVEDGELLVLSAALMSATAYEVFGVGEGRSTGWSAALVLLTIVFVSPFSIFKTAHSSFPITATMWLPLIRAVSCLVLVGTSSLLVYCRWVLDSG